MYNTAQNHVLLVTYSSLIIHFWTLDIYYQRTLATQQTRWRFVMRGVQSSPFEEVCLG